MVELVISADMASDIYTYIYIYIYRDYLCRFECGVRIIWVNNIFVCVKGERGERREGGRGGICTSFNMRTLPERPWISVSF